MPAEQTKQPWESRLRDGASHAEEEVQRLIRYLNDEVVPEVRRNGSLALKAAATGLQRLAERMDEANHPPPPAGPQTKRP